MDRVPNNTSLYKIWFVIRSCSVSCSKDSGPHIDGFMSYKSFCTKLKRRCNKFLDMPTVMIL